MQSYDATGAVSLRGTIHYISAVDKVIGQNINQDEKVGKLNVDIGACCKN